LIEKCGLDRLVAAAKTLDLAVVSVGDIGPKASSLARHLVTERNWPNWSRSVASAT
jgi:DNA-binding transcriptional regulator LsrR (DeoR family)